MNLTTKPAVVVTVLLLAAGFSVGAAFYWIDSSPEATTPTETSSGMVYACPMHPEESLHHEGMCHQCGMALQPVAGPKQVEGCAGHTSSCCAKPSPNALRLPPGHPPVAGFTVATSPPFNAL